MKYLKTFESSESDPILDELMDNLLFISDELGEPKVTKSVYDKTQNMNMYEFSWKMKFNLENMNSLEMLKGFRAVLNEICDLTAMEEKMPGFIFEISLNSDVPPVADKSDIRLRVTPKSKTTGNYVFIKGQNHREIILNRIGKIQISVDRALYSKNNSNSHGCHVFWILWVVYQPNLGKQVVKFSN